MRAGDGATVGRYQVLEVVGRGGFGVVYKAIDPKKPGCYFAVKLVSCDHFDAVVAAGARDTALAEAQLLQHLRHPHVVNCHEVCYDERQHVVWLALDFLDGGDLQKHIEARKRVNDAPFEANFVRQVLTSVGSALRYMHSKDVLHRDVKPSNILLTAEQRDIKLTDFGIAKMLESTARAHTIIGTPSYLSPELVCGEAYGKSADAWALGVVLYELLALRRPFDASNQLALATRIVETQPPPLPLGTSSDLAQAVASLLLKDPLQRASLAQALTMSTNLPPPPAFPPPCVPESYLRGTSIRSALPFETGMGDDLDMLDFEELPVVHDVDPEELPNGVPVRQMSGTSLHTQSLSFGWNSDVPEASFHYEDGALCDLSGSSAAVSPAKNHDAFGLSELEKEKRRKSFPLRYLGLLQSSAAQQEDVMPMSAEDTVEDGETLSQARPSERSTEGRRWFGFTLRSSKSSSRARSQSPPKQDSANAPAISLPLCSPRRLPWIRY